MSECRNVRSRGQACPALSCELGDDARRQTMVEGCTYSVLICTLYAVLIWTALIGGETGDVKLARIGDQRASRGEGGLSGRLQSLVDVRRMS